MHPDVTWSRLSPACADNRSFHTRNRVSFPPPTSRSFQRSRTWPSPCRWGRRRERTAEACQSRSRPGGTFARRPACRRFEVSRRRRPVKSNPNAANAEPAYIPIVDGGRAPLRGRSLCVLTAARFGKKQTVTCGVGVVVAVTAAKSAFDSSHPLAPSRYYGRWRCPSLYLRSWFLIHPILTSDAEMMP